MLGPTSREFSEDSAVDMEQILVRSPALSELMERPICPMAEIVALQTQETLPLMHRFRQQHTEQALLFSRLRR